MAVSYKELEQAALSEAHLEQERFAVARRQTMARELHRIEQEAAQSEQETIRQATQRQQKETAAKTRDYAHSAVQRAVTQRQWQQRLAERGLSHSGFQRTAQSRAAGQKATADMAVTLLLKKRRTALSQDLADRLETQRQKQQKAAATLQAAAEKEIAANEKALTKIAKARANEQYKAVKTAK